MNNLIVLVMAFLLVLFVSLFWYQLTGICTEESMAASAITIMLSVFLFALMGKAHYAYGSAIVLSGIGVILFGLNKGKGRKEMSFFHRVREFVTPSVVVITGIFLYAVLFFRNTLFTYPDEVHQWGNAIKYMIRTDMLPHGNNFGGDSVTFSVCTMFQYFFSGIGKFVESNAFVGNFLLAFIPVLLPCRKMGWTKWKKIFLYVLLIFLSFNLISNIKYYTLLQDYVLPMWTGGILAWLVWKKEEKINGIFLFMSLTVIAAMKSLVGPLFVLMIIVTVCLVMYFESDKNNEVSIREQIFQKKYLYILPLLITPVLFNYIWSNIISTNVLSRGVGSSNKNAVDIFFTIIGKCFDAVGGDIDVVPYFSYAIYILIYILGVKVCLVLAKEKQKMVQIIFGLYVIGAILYVGVMFYAYMNVFSAGDSAIAAGLDRYLAYYMLAGVGTILYPIVFQNLYSGKSILIKALPFVLLIIGIFGTGDSFMQKATGLQQDTEVRWQKRVAVKEQVKQLKKLVPDEGQIFIIGNLKINDVKMLSYELQQQYRWELDSYTITNQQGEYQILVDAVKYPELLLKTGYRYVWFRNPKEENREYDYLRYYFGIESINDGDIYEIVKEKEQYRFHYVGNVQAEEEE